MNDSRRPACGAVGDRDRQAVLRRPPRTQSTMVGRARRSPTRTSQRSRALPGRAPRRSGRRRRASRRRRCRRGERGRGRSPSSPAQRVERVRREGERAAGEHERVEPVLDLERERRRGCTRRARNATSHAAACATRIAPRSASQHIGRDLPRTRGAPRRAAASMPCTCAAPPTRSPGSTSVLTNATALAADDPLDAHLDDAIVRRRRAPSSRGRRTRAAPPRSGRSQGGPGGGGTLAWSRVVRPIESPADLMSFAKKPERRRAGQGLRISGRGAVARAAGRSCRTVLFGAGRDRRARPGRSCATTRTSCRRSMRVAASPRDAPTYDADAGEIPVPDLAYRTATRASRASAVSAR